MRKDKKKMKIFWNKNKTSMIIQKLHIKLLLTFNYQSQLNVNNIFAKDNVKFNVKEDKYFRSVACAEISFRPKYAWNRISNI